MFFFAFESISDNTPDNLMPILSLLLGWPSPDEPCDLEPLPTVERMNLLHGEKDREKSSLYAEWRGETARALTLAALVANPHIALAESDRRAIRERVIRWELARQASMDTAQAWDMGVSPEVFQSLLSRPKTFEDAMSHLCQTTLARNTDVLLLAGCRSVSDLKPLSGLCQLQILWLDETPVSDLSPLNGLRALRVLWLDRTSVSDLKPLVSLHALQLLGLDGCISVSDLTPLRGLRNLQILSLRGCSSVRDLTPLSELREVNTLCLDGSTVSDLTPLRELLKLQSLSLKGCTSVSDASVAALKAKLPNLNIIR
jgi:hypothetical protein